MSNITFIEHDGTATTVAIEAGLSLMEGAVRGGIAGIEAECGGACVCATCHVYVPAEWQGLTGEASEMEAAMLESADDPRPNSRLACQITVSDAFDGMTVHVPEAQG
ncbi:2Fe-2S iron-sulfur cluster-binding protein [Croceicoccus sediminis]|uniref:2Fe-2S iron-sulfur cluster-binding protein n=1 Tax=Croceicoccus sediminis TaxID=2571150 RepID=UPI001182E1EE|nr:2Fe-2S iron-sulfur cluster-binding protein [Croceicoccus sediminis]